jgi:hypothetical protein
VTSIQIPFCVKEKDQPVAGKLWQLQPRFSSIGRTLMHFFFKFRDVLGVRASTGRVPLLPLEKTILCRPTYGREEKE